MIVAAMNFRINWDALGVATSLACAVHCAVLPLVLTSLPIFGVNIIDNHSFEFLMIVLAAAIGGYSLWHGYKKHHHKMLPVSVFLFGMLFLFAKQIWHQHQVPLLFMAVLFIVAGHWLNYRACRIHDHAHKEDCDH
jgi:CHASE2 domain-containing sensor protein